MNSINKHYQASKIYVVINFTTQDQFIDCTASDLEGRLQWHLRKARKTTCDRPMHVFMRANPSYEYKIQCIKTVKCSYRRDLESITARFIKQRAMQMRVLLDTAHSEFEHNAQIYMVVNNINDRKEFGTSYGNTSVVQALKDHIETSSDEQYETKEHRHEYLGFLNRNADVVLRGIFMESIHTDDSNEVYGAYITYIDETSCDILGRRERFQDGRGTIEYDDSDSECDDSEDESDDEE